MHGLQSHKGTPSGGKRVHWVATYMKLLLPRVPLPLPRYKGTHNLRSAGPSTTVRLSQHTRSISKHFRALISCGLANCYQIFRIIYCKKFGDQNNRVPARYLLEAYGHLIENSNRTARHNTFSVHLRLRLDLHLRLHTSLYLVWTFFKILLWALHSRLLAPTDLS